MPFLSPTRRLLLATALAFGLVPGMAEADAEPVRVVATFSILGDMAERIGGDRVAVTTLVGADADAHVYQPTPTDARVIAGAEVLIANGMGFEGWLDRLVAASGFSGTRVVATDGITALLEDDGEVDPHAWQSLTNAKTYVANITDALVAADPDGAGLFTANLEAYLAEIAEVDEAVRAFARELPAALRTVVTAHDGFRYFEADYGIAFAAPVGVSTEAEASAADVAALIRQIRDQNIPAIFVENITDDRLLRQIASETGAVIGGTLYSDALSPPGGPAPTYLDMFRHNLATLRAALVS